jgi:hypothetical protein
VLIIAGAALVGPDNGSESLDAVRNSIPEGERTVPGRSAPAGRTDKLQGCHVNLLKITGIQHYLPGGIECIGKNLFEFGAGFYGQRFANDYRCQFPVIRHC